MKTNKSVLLVDDDTAWLTLVKEELLSNPKIEVIPCKYPELALRLVQTHLFDLVITDTNMPKMDGITLLQAIREIDPFIPILVLFTELQGAHLNKEDVLNLGADKVITKNDAMNWLDKEIEHLIR
jgi:DNA-binding response OmpR family regulator